MIGSVSSPTDELLERGRAALRSGAAQAARRAFDDALSRSESPAAIEGLARACYLALDFDDAIEQWERAYAAFRAAGDQIGAVRVARTLGYMYGAIRGDSAVSGGWIARAQTLLGDDDSAERGWVALDIGMFHPDRQAKDAHLQQALAVARATGDRDLEFVSLAYLGASLVHGDRTEEGMVLLDEALAAVAGYEVDDFTVLEEIFCQLFSACEHAHDVERADQWIRVGEVLAARRNLPSVGAFCRTHYGGLLTVAGRWPEAEAALSEAVRLWGLGQNSLRAGALARLADLRVRQGRYEEAEQLLATLDVNADTARPLAALHLARGRTALAADVAERGLAALDPTGMAAAPLWAILVDVHLAAGALDDAAAAVEQLERCAERHPRPHLAATAALARGRLCLAGGRGDPAQCLRAALGGFTRAQMPVEVARSRLELAAALADERPEVALAEARAALEAFERLEAARHADAAAALLRRLGAATGSTRRVSGQLTRRESEVLGLLGHGLSNAEISDRLFISRKTVEHHVASVLSKLGLRSRAEAAAYAARLGPTAG